MTENNKIKLIASLQHIMYGSQSESIKTSVNYIVTGKVILYYNNH